MSQRIEALTKLIKQRDLLAPCVAVEHDPLDFALPEPVFNAKRIIEYILAQPVFLTEDSRFTGMLRYDKAEVPGDFFQRPGHTHFQEALSHFYANHGSPGYEKNYQENLAIMEWQHSAPDYANILQNGLVGSLRQIALAKEKYRFDREKTEFLEAEEIICNGIIAWANRCAEVYEQAAAQCTDAARKEELLAVAQNCRHVPQYPSRSFYEGLHCVLFCFHFLPDSIGTLDRCLFALYRQDIDSGKITREQAKELLQEFYVHICNRTPVGNGNVDNSAECHFAIGGYTERGEDGFTDFSRLIVEALMEIDTRRPAISLRWTKKTPFEVLRYMLDCERHDQNKRIAFVSDEPRLEALTKRIGLPFSEAVRYTMVGCNELAFPGTVWKSGATINLARALTNTLYACTEEICACRTFEEFYAIFRRELHKDMEKAIWYADLFDAMRAKDHSVLSAFLLDGCLENGAAPNRGGCNIKLGGFNVMGLTCVIDSLTVIKQFVFMEKKTDLKHLVEVLESNWEKDEILHTDILKNGRFFGNADELSDEMARKISYELGDFFKDRRLRQGEKILLGTLSGYNAHYASYGRMTKATPDGRHNGETFMVGSGQANGKDRNGLTALMRSLAQSDPTHIFCGPVVCNMMIDEVLVRDDTYFEKLCHMVEAYFRMGGLHVQFNYVSKEHLLAARCAPEQHANLKVRVSGYSASFVGLDNDIQEEILQRTSSH